MDELQKTGQLRSKLRVDRIRPQRPARQARPVDRSGHRVPRSIMARYADRVQSLGVRRRCWLMPLLTRRSFKAGVLVNEDLRTLGRRRPSARHRQGQECALGAGAARGPAKQRWQSMGEAEADTLARWSCRRKVGSGRYSWPMLNSVAGGHQQERSCFRSHPRRAEGCGLVRHAWSSRLAARRGARVGASNLGDGESCRAMKTALRCSVLRCRVQRMFLGPCARRNVRSVAEPAATPAPSLVLNAEPAPDAEASADDSCTHPASAWTIAPSTSR